MKKQKIIMNIKIYKKVSTTDIIFKETIDFLGTKRLFYIFFLAYFIMKGDIKYV